MAESLLRKLGTSTYPVAPVKADVYKPIILLVIPKEGKGIDDFQDRFCTICPRNMNNPGSQYVQAMELVKLGNDNYAPALRCAPKSPEVADSTPTPASSCVYDAHCDKKAFVKL